MERYTDKIVMITGAGDVALAIAERMLGEGARIAFTDFSETALTAAVNEMTASGFGEDRVMTVQCDVRSQDACDAAVTAITARWSRIDTMVATAGIIRHLPIDQMSEKDWQDVIDINLSGVFRACKAVVPGMKEKRYGRIVIISSIGGRTGRNVGVNYAASKAGVNGIAMNLGYCLAPWNITVNTVAPGPLKGRMFSSMTQEQQDSLAAGIPLGHVGELSDVAAAAAYLGSDDAAWTTGEVLDVNGGLQY